MDRTLRASLLAAFIAFAALAGLGIFLGFPMTGSLVTGAVAGVLAAMLILGAARRADSFHADTPPPVEPGFPGPPDHAGDAEAAGHDDDAPDRRRRGHDRDDPR